MASTSVAPALAAREVSVNFGGVSALTGVSLGFDASEICGLIGPNGAGKTTLFDTLSGVRVPSSGIVELHGADVTGRSATWRARRGLRRTFQRQQMFGWLSVEDNVLVALDWRGGGGGILGDVAALPARRQRERQRRERVAVVLEMCGLAPVRKAAAGTLPIGQARLVEMARAIVDSPKILLLDEPSSGLAESEVDELAHTMHVIREEQSCAVVVVEHDVGFVMRNCERVVVLNLGQVIADAPPDVVRVDPAVREAYLG